MGLLDGLLNAAGGGGGTLEAVTGMLGSHEGGLGGLLASFERGGLGDIAKSWVSTGSNLPISADQISAVLSHGAIADIAKKLGVDPTAAAGQLASLLPQVIDHLTPNGQVPPGGGLGAITDLLGKFKL